MSSAAARAPSTREGEVRTRAASPMRMAVRPAKAPLPASCRGHSPRQASCAGAGAAPPHLRRSHSAGATPTTRTNTPPPPRPPPPGRPAAAAAAAVPPTSPERTAGAKQERVQALLLSLGDAQALAALEACYQQLTTNKATLPTPARETAAAPTAGPARGRAAAESRQDSARREGAMRDDSPSRGRVSQRAPLHMAKGQGGGKGAAAGGLFERR